MYHDIIVLGGGASGIIAAIIAKDRGLDVAIVEGNDRIGKKILSTGNGRCNITNKNVSIKNYHSLNKNFFNYVLNKFSVENTIEFFYSLGLPLVELDHGKMYPMSLQASSVLDILRLALEERNIPIYLNNKIKYVKKSNNIFSLITLDNNIFNCNKLVLSCGGKSAPNTGSDGSGFTLAQSLGHKIISPTPGLVQLKLKYNKLKALSGIKFVGLAKLYISNDIYKEELGEILFTDYGISGPPILQLSNACSKALYSKRQVTLLIDMYPGLTKDSLRNFLENHWGIFSYRSVFESLIGIIHKKLIPIILKESNILDIHKPCIELTWNEKSSLLKLLKSWSFEVYDTNSFNNSQVTCGGIDTKYINPETLESNIVSNLYFTGEILDVDGDCGGFNLQWAWSSGYVVGNTLK
ncbi:hypothetical protein BD780_003744 [Clostridium tetanomorphum]|uniref:NAD(P)/FAD-dependent oxidoreductase n=1 Tax=Clostridium tetanomorphum TaxID=1553 RepID=UPI0004502AB6|nr:NAD(P)/FAD-dependent oxidoreductase [Clostridium tetanomorphum]KAJ50558.1 NAD(FAD)-utilizing dehydrogenase [Clostridium tetanomorphum DSM 665]MBP1866522.1 putative Rossmann fold flavoprotein [Clostridium tetanomorphum]NRS86519.1 hypothetical protein [Clostridium tetanomorphum]SQC00946.1 NAD(FAD)-utilizing dehydrogenase [Clostridium tetanomorphum]